MSREMRLTSPLLTYVCDGKILRYPRVTIMAVLCFWRKNNIAGNSVSHLATRAIYPVTGIAQRCYSPCLHQVTAEGGGQAAANVHGHATTPIYACAE